MAPTKPTFCNRRKQATAKDLVVHRTARVTGVCTPQDAREGSSDRFPIKVTVERPSGRMESKKKKVPKSARTLTHCIEKAAEYYETELPVLLAKLKKIQTKNELYTAYD